MKPQKITLGKLVPVAKPQKKAFTTAEFYKVKDLMKVLPAGHRWIVSYKADGIRCQLHKNLNNIKFMSDEAKLIPNSKIPLVFKAARKLPRKIILDGELMLFLDGKVQEHQGVAAMVHRKANPTAQEIKGTQFRVWDCLHLNDVDIDKRPYLVRFNTLKKMKLSPPISIVKYKITGLQGVPQATRQVMSNEGAMIRAMDSTYWQDNMMFKLKRTFDVDVKIIKVEKKIGGVVYHCVNSEGKYVGRTYKQTYLKDAKPGDIIRVTVSKVYRRKDPKPGEAGYTWYSPNVAPPKFIDKRWQRPAKRADGRETFRKIHDATVGL